MRAATAVLSIGSLVIGLALSACSPSIQERRFSFVDGDLSLRLESVDAAEADRISEVLRRRLQPLGTKWHAWKPSELTALNQALAQGRTHEASPELLKLVQDAVPLHLQSDGLFDPAIGSLISLWGFHTDTFPVTTPAPSTAQLAAWETHRAYLSDLRIVGNRITSPQRSLQLDFGAVTDGAGGVLALRLLREQGVRRALVSFGNDMLALGDDHRLPLADPFGGNLAEVRVDDGEALFSTGNFNRFRDAPDGARWGHVLDPRSGLPAQGAAMVAVLHRDSFLADAAATALAAGGPARFESLAKRLKLGCALMVTDENELLITRAFGERIEFERMPVPLGDAVDVGADCSP